MMAAGRPSMRVQLSFWYKRKVSGSDAQRFKPEYACIGVSGSRDTVSPSETFTAAAGGC